MTFEHRVDGRLAVWDLTEVVEPTDAETAALLEDFRTVTSSSDLVGVVFELYDGDEISGDSFDDIPSFVAVAEQSSIERVAIASGGDASVVVFGRVHGADLEISVFDDVEDAIEWTRRADDSGTRADTGRERPTDPDVERDALDGRSSLEHGR
ncbi:hypothetical protein HUG10_02475 [Halorarum halophilum]|uniref:SpoIIAA-like n=1 Tax=Halorarum halophilum TaxID=2743090 RepID=A0A7D5GXX3_9EURY|nr:hypothetical protein [Halobaculum halophilum]QLG26473.1 hypothetical protein HUG10_02475 [Halobaculum halophilum]